MQSGCAARSRDMFWPIYIYIFAGANFCSLFLASHHHVYHVQGSSSPGSLSPHSVSQQLPCTSHAYEIRSNHPSCQDPGEGQDGLSCRQTCQCDGLLGNVRVGSTCASCLDNVVVAWVAPYGIMWEADIPSADVCTATPLSPAFLDQGRLGHGMRYEPTFPL